MPKTTKLPKPTGTNNHEVFQDPHVKAHEIVVELPHLLLGSIPQLAYPVWINNERSMSKQYPPLMGEHTRNILRELGYNDREVEELYAKGVVK